MIATKVYPVIKEVYETQSRYENIAIPITDGRKVMQVIANLKKAFETNGKEVPLSIDKGITLAMIDDSWKEHLREMDELRQSVQSASYEQKDPLLIYKFESFELFKKMLDKINKESISFIIKGNLPIQDTGQVREAAQVRARPDMSKLKEERTDLLSQAYSNTQQTQRTGPVKVEKKVGRNDPCPCGSGKKYKHCHGAGK
jgi:preprotein translocase subunit SecA